MQIMDLMARQADHEQKMRELQERFGNATRRAIEEIPTEPFYHRYPDVFKQTPCGSHCRRNPPHSQQPSETKFLPEPR